MPCIMLRALACGLGVATGLIALAATVQTMSWPGGEPAGQVVEIRVYTLKPGVRDRFHRLFLEQALPMLRRWNVDVVAYGPSLHDDDSYVLMRAFPSVEVRERSEDAFYGSQEWKSGPREAILAAIETYSTVVVRVDDDTVQGLRRLSGGTPAAAVQ